MMPSRVAIALQHDGWILRNDIIWHKPNHMPSSVKDRLANAYEHVFLLAKNQLYYFDLDAIRKTHAQPISKEYETWYLSEREQKDWLRHRSSDDREEMGWPGKKGSGIKNMPHPKGKNPGDIWRIPTAPFPGAHFATFPPKLIEPIVKVGCPQNGVVLDPFGGSGIVGQVARRLGRRFILIEIKPEYAEMARQRIRGIYKPRSEDTPDLSHFLQMVPE
jgi:site-specific DNA-methyltransferase (cytosine-N4-specific)